MLPLPISLAKAAACAAKAQAAKKSGDSKAHKAHCAETMCAVKKAGAEMSMASDLIGRALKGLAVGTGVAIPAAIAGSYLANQIGDRAHQEAEATRDYIGKAALGIGLAGAGLYAMNQLGRGGGGGYSPEMYGATPEDAGAGAYGEYPEDLPPEFYDEFNEKFSSADRDCLQEFTEKLASIGVVDAVAGNTLSTSTDDVARKLASDVIDLNNAYLVQVINELG